MLERLLWRVLGTTAEGHARWTDDTQMSIDLIDSLIERHSFDPDDIARRFAVGYRWSRGYGPGAAKVLKRIARGQDWRHANRAVFPEGSYGNGGAMRAPAIGLFLCRRLGELSNAVSLVSSITHAHPLAIEGATLVALATALALLAQRPHEIGARLGRTCRLAPFAGKLAIANSWLESLDAPAAPQVAASLGNGIAAGDSCITAIYIALRFMHDPFLAMQQFVVNVGGDVDTIGAMAGAIWGAGNGIDSLPLAELMKLEQKDRLLEAACGLYRAEKLIYQRH